MVVSSPLLVASYDKRDGSFLSAARRGMTSVGGVFGRLRRSVSMILSKGSS